MQLRCAFITYYLFVSGVEGSSDPEGLDSKLTDVKITHKIKSFLLLFADLSIDNKENLYDEVAQKERPPNMELLVPVDESNRVSSASDDYELVEVVANPNSPIVRTTEDNYSEVVEREPGSNLGGARGRPVSVEICGAPANVSVSVTSFSGAVDGNVENDEMSLYEQVERPKQRKEPSNVSQGWV